MLRTAMGRAPYPRLPQAPALLAAMIGLLGLIAMPGCSTRASGKDQKPAMGFPPPAVVVAPVIRKTVPIYGEYVGQTAAVNMVEIRSQVEGFLEKISFVEGSTVQKGQLLFEIDPREYEAAVMKAKASLAQSEAALVKSKQDVARYRPLVGQHAISQEQLDTAVAQAAEDEANVEAAKAQLAQAELNLGYTKITAPLTGRIGQAQMKVGALVQAGTSLLDTLYSINPIYVNFSVSEAMYLEKKLHGKSAAAFPPIELVLGDGSAYRYKGRVDMLAPEVDPATGTLSIRAEFPNPEGVLRPGLFVRARMVTSEKANALLVPVEAIQEVQGAQSVLVVGNDNKVEFRTITAAETVGNLRIVESGVQAGDRVIVQGLQKVRPGMPVTPQEQQE
ncbi:MAG TPA: efflux RND transporter periplasmic adaptor subunit [Terriglobia bacterium]|nr:efflux RND transporter periplasmic adaptor subunit [Terriglobia bacterium]